jgi:argininosuccinate synthase
MKYENIQEHLKSKKTEKIVLAYSGGLDTSILLTWLTEKNYEVYCLVADVGQPDDFNLVKNKAIQCGAKDVKVVNMQEKLVDKYLFKALQANAVYEGKYLLGTAIARPVISKALADYAKEIDTKIIAHGATGKGNDQIRFEQGLVKFIPDVSIVSPWKDQYFLDEFKGRKDMIAYAQKKNIPISATLKKPYSMDENIIHTSYESGILEDPKQAYDEDMFKMTCSPKNALDKETNISIEFEKGKPVKIINLDSKDEITGPVNMLNYLNKIGGENAIGRSDLVENRYVGLKSRGVYETPGYSILLKAHLDIEGLTLDKELGHLKDMLMPKISELIYNGLWFSPEMKCLWAFVEESQKYVQGKVYLSLYKGNIIIKGRESEKSLYNEADSSMDEFGDFDQLDSKGFVKINTLRLSYFSKVNGVD